MSQLFQLFPMDLADVTFQHSVHAVIHQPLIFAVFIVVGWRIFQSHRFLIEEKMKFFCVKSLIFLLDHRGRMQSIIQPSPLSWLVGNIIYHTRIVQAFVKVDQFVYVNLCYFSKSVTTCTPSPCGWLNEKESEYPTKWLTDS